MHSAVKIIGPSGVIGAIASIFIACSSAPAAPAASGAQQEAAAGASYKIDTALCVDKTKYPTLRESNACVAAVDAKWHRLSDGGPDPVWFAADGGAR